ncbi:MAG: hypothetical protein ACOYX5_19080 [Actinomycetota bacterium]
MRRAIALTTLAAALLLPLPATAMASGEEIDGGAAATQATPVEPGTTYLDDVAPGEARWFSVDVMTAQDYGVTLTEYGDTEYNCCLSVAWYDSDFDRDMGDSGFNTDGTAKTFRVASEGGVDEDGTRYLEIRLDEDSANRQLSFEFVVDVTGEGVAAESPSASPTEAASEEPAADEADSADEDEPEAAAVDAGDDGGNTMLWVVVGLLVLLVVLLIAVVVLLMVRMRKAGAVDAGSAQQPVGSGQSPTQQG